MQGSGDGQGKSGHVCTKVIAIVRMHSIVALHGADRCRYHRAAGITKRLAGFKIGMFADDAVAPDFLDIAVGIGNQPMAMEQFCRYFSGVGDGDRVGEDIAILIRRRLRFYKKGCRLNYYFVFFVHYWII